MPTLFNKLSADEQQKFIAANPNLNASQLGALNKDKVDLDGFTSSQIAQYKAALDVKPTKNPANPANPQNPPNPLSFGAATVAIKPDIKSPPHRSPNAPLGSVKK